MLNKKCGPYISLSGAIIDYLNLMPLNCYNCLGWSIGENKWLHTPKETFKNKNAAKQEVDAFLRLHLDLENRKLFDNSINVKKFIHLTEENKATQEGTLAMYFQKLDTGKMKWLHAARYSSSLKVDGNKLEVNTWTSKLGMGPLVPHYDPEQAAKCVYKATTDIFYAQASEYLSLSGSNLEIETDDL